MTGVAHVVVILRGAGGAEGVVSAAGILDYLDQRLEIDVVEFRVQAGRRVGGADHVPGRGGVQVTFDPLFEQRCVKALEIGAFASLDVDDLDIVAGLDLVRVRGARFDPIIEQRVGERIGHADHALGFLTGLAMDEYHQVGGGVLRLGAHGFCRRRDDRGQIILHAEPNRVAGR